MLDKIKIALQYVTPKHLLSRVVGYLAQAELGGFSHFLIKAFIKQYKVDMQEAQLEEASEYASFNTFFTRSLKDGIRPIDDTADSLCHPVDGTVSQLGPIKDGRIFQAKGFDFSAQELLGGNATLAKEFDKGDFATIYLAPSDYHRIHMPVTGELRTMIYVPGDLFSVNPLTAQNVPNLFARNERVVAIFDTEHGPMAMVLVGATIVASIETVWAGTVTPPTRNDVVWHDYPKGQHILEKGAEMGRFKLGSTVVLLFAEDAITFESSLTTGDTTRLGQLLATTSP
ncbi:phosphatidylserine decarboxylase [Alginatibacterium sediminis]|uniref:Phosphatidylserine decarboxylase proenzyme n=1 Tax=Alginatibacterium sediminis TaxID=2164068 RepID=A0A420E7T4_9ALTE|nr:archaetidylserine decarboxylase [Alginatibacterium sediminis]RKF14518.1 phosphatidylserine decarboxylase [Alginatibacterium sediminis]